MRQAPPALGRFFLHLRPLGSRRAEVEADLLELFELRSAESGRAVARRAYWRDVLSLWWHDRPGRAQVQRLPSPSFGFEVQIMWQDIVFALRLLRRRPALFGITIAGIALAIGISTAVFGVFSALGWPTHGVRDSDHVFKVIQKDTTNNSVAQQWPYSAFGTLRAAAPVALVGHLDESASLAEQADSTPGRSVGFAAVSGTYFSTLAGPPALGRTLAPEDDRAGAPHVLVLSHGLWKGQFGSDPAVVGRTTWMRGQPFTIVGIAGRGFSGPSDRMPPAFWITLAAYGEVSRGDVSAQRERVRAQIALLQGSASAADVERRHGFDAQLAKLSGPWDGLVSIHARIDPGVAVGRVQAQLTSLAEQYLREHGNAERAGHSTVRLDQLDLESNPETGASAAIVGTVVALLLLIACANLTHVLLACAAGRQREIGTRLALGASRRRIVRQLLTESLLLGGAGGLVGLVVSLWLTPLLGRILNVPAQVDFAPDMRVFLFVAGVTCIAGLGAGLAPALHGRRGDMQRALKAASGSGTGRLPAGRLRSLLVGAAAAASVTLLVVAALFARALVHINTVELGFHPERLVSVSFNLGRDYDDVRRMQYIDAAIENVRQIPGVSNAAFAAYGPMGGGGSFARSLGDSAPGGGTDALGGSIRRVHQNATSADYFATIGLPVLRGRVFTPAEVRSAAPVAVISASLARAAWGDADPIGSSLERVWGADDAPGAKRIGLMSKPAGTRVVGVVADSVTQLMRPQASTIYLPMDNTTYGRLLVSAANPRAAAGAIQEVLRALEPDLMDLTPSFVDDGFERELSFPLAIATIGSMLGLSALLLATVGLFGVTAFVVDARRHEVSIRLALGATRRAILQLLMTDCLRPVVGGLLVGLVLALIGGRIIQAVLFGVSPHDPLAIGGAALLLIVSAILAVLIPARHAMRIDPAQVLKAD